MDGSQWFLGDFMKIYLDHIGIACEELDSASKFWNLIGLIQGEDELVESQGVTTRFFSTSEGNTETPTKADSPIGRFLSKRGPGIQQICFRVDNLQEMISFLLENGVQMIDQEPKEGSHGALIAFVHPKSTGGVLVELAQK